MPALGWLMNLNFAASGVVATVDNRTVSHLVTILMPAGDAIRMRAVRTDGSDDLQTVDEGSSLNVKVIR